MLSQVQWHNMPTVEHPPCHLEHIMATRNVVLTDHLEQVVNDLVLSGRYQNASEVLREGLRLLEQREAEEAAKVDALRNATSIGLMDLEQGRFVDVHGEDLGKFLDDLGTKTSLPSSERH
jgi:antitoxin ParD1/3/4